MKVAVFNNIVGGLERFTPYLEPYKNEIELVKLNCPPDIDQLDQLKEKGCEAMFFTNGYKQSAEFFRKIAAMGVKYVCTPSAGYDHFNIPAMKEAGLKGAYVPVYSPNAIAEHTVMMLLSLLRNLRSQIHRIENDNFRLEGLMGREVRNLKIGIVGAGRIGYTTMKCLSGFAPKKIYAYDPYENEAVKEYAEYTALENLYAECDAVIYHCIYNGQNHHMVNEKTIAMMKDGVVLINVARGPIFDNQAILDGIESGKIGALGIDVIEGEEAVKMPPPYDLTTPFWGQLHKLLSYDNVLYTRHSAFYTDEAYGNLTKTAMENMAEYARTGSCQNELVQK